MRLSCVITKVIYLRSSCLFYLFPSLMKDSLHIHISHATIQTRCNINIGTHFGEQDCKNNLFDSSSPWEVIISS